MTLHKGKGNKDEFNNYRRKNFPNVPGKVHDRVLTERLMEVTNEKVREEYGGFKKGGGCVDQIFVIKFMVKKTIIKPS